jgi:hypothetical protein
MLTIERRAPLILILTAGEWYLVAICEYYHTKHVLEGDPSKGTTLPKDYYQSQCPGCLRIGLYLADQIERYQYPKVKEQPPIR